MNKLIVSLFVLLPFAAVSQTSYIINKPDGKTQETLPILKNDVTLTSVNKVDAKVIVKGITDADRADLVMTYFQDSTQVITPDFAGDSLVYDLGSELGRAQNLFKLTYKGIVYYKFLFNENNNVTADAEKPDDLTTYLAALANANFVGNNKFLSNLTPVVNLGAIINLKKDTIKDKGFFNWNLDINPYIGAQIDTKDSVSFIPALMLPGRAGFAMNTYLSWSNPEVEFTWMPLGFGLKIIPDIKDSATNIWQHNFRTGISLKYKDIFIIGTQFTYGFHNTTSESKNFYKKVFSHGSTDIKYLNISGQFFIASKDETTKSNVLFIEWRGLLSKKVYAGFNNISILTIGFRKDLSLTNTFSTAATRATAAGGSNKRGAYKKRPSVF